MTGRETFFSLQIEGGKNDSTGETHTSKLKKEKVSDFSILNVEHNYSSTDGQDWKHLEAPSVCLF